MAESLGDDIDELIVRQRRHAFMRWTRVALTGLTFALSLVVGIFESPGWRVRKVIIYAPDRELARELRSVAIDGPISYALHPASRVGRRVKASSHRVAAIAWARKFPSDRSIRVFAVPRRPAAAVSSANEPRAFMLVDSTGFVYAPVAHPPDDVPLLVAFPTPTIGVGHFLPPRARAVFFDVIEGLAKGHTPLRKADFSNIADIVAFLRSGTKIKLGYFDNLQRKFAYAGIIAREARRRRIAVRYIDVSVLDRPFIMPKSPVRRPEGRPATLAVDAAL